MILRTHGRIARQSGRFMKVTPAGDIVLTFEVIGSFFPARHISSSQTTFYLSGQNNVENKLYIDYGDGTGEHEIAFKATGQLRRLYFGSNAGATSPGDISQTGNFNTPVHFFQDLPLSVRNTVDDFYPTRHTVKMRFQKPEAVTNILTNRLRLYNQLPSALAKLVNMETLSIQGAYFITSFPQDFYNSRVRTLTLANVGDIMNAGFPNWALNSPISMMNLTDSINLSGTADLKKFNQINKLKDYLTYLNLTSAGINYVMPPQLNELYKLAELYLDNNGSPDMRFPVSLSGLTSLHTIDISRSAMPFSEVERIVQSIPSLRTLSYRNSGITTDRDFISVNTTLESITIGGTTWNNGAVPSFVNKLTGLKSLSLYQFSTNLGNFISGWGSFQNCINLNTLTIARNTAMPVSIPAWFSALTKLKNIIAGGCYGTQTRINDFVNNLYAFTISNAPITGTSAGQFRSMSIDVYGNNSNETGAAVRPGGTFQQPAGYVQGSSNGSPVTPMEKIWVLTNQYGHLWTVKPQ